MKVDLDRPMLNLLFPFIRSWCENNFTLHFSPFRPILSRVLFKWPFLTFPVWLGWASEKLSFCIKMTWTLPLSAFLLPASPLQRFSSEFSNNSSFGSNVCYFTQFKWKLASFHSLSSLSPFFIETFLFDIFITFFIAKELSGNLMNFETFPSSFSTGKLRIKSTQTVLTSNYEKFSFS